MEYIWLLNTKMYGSSIFSNLFLGASPKVSGFRQLFFLLKKAKKEFCFNCFCKSTGVTFRKVDIHNLYELRINFVSNPLHLEYFSILLKKYFRFNLLIYRVCGNNGGRSIKLFQQIIWIIVRRSITFALPLRERGNKKEVLG
jgi:hypothetical protein